MPRERPHGAGPELGPGWRPVLELDRQPAAAASIGQVHRGVWKDGREVAVKIQYPGAGDALISDLHQIGRRRAIAPLVPGWTSSRSSTS